MSGCQTHYPHDSTLSNRRTNLRTSKSHRCGSRLERATRLDGRANRVNEPSSARRVPILLLLVAIGLASGASAVKSQVVIEDIFERQLDQAQIILVDWDGYLANPAITLFVRPPDNAALPGTATLSSSEPIMYFDLPSTYGENGPTKSLALPNAESTESFLLSIFPDRDTEDEDHVLVKEMLTDNFPTHLFFCSQRNEPPF